MTSFPVSWSHVEKFLFRKKVFPRRVVGAWRLSGGGSSQALSAVGKSWHGQFFILAGIGGLWGDPPGRVCGTLDYELRGFFLKHPFVS